VYAFREPERVGGGEVDFFLCGCHFCGILLLSISVFLVVVVVVGASLSHTHNTQEKRIREDMATTQQSEDEKSGLYAFLKSLASATGDLS